MPDFDFEKWLKQRYPLTTALTDTHGMALRDFRELIEAADHAVSGMETFEGCDCRSCRLIRALCNLGVLHD